MVAWRPSQGGLFGNRERTHGEEERRPGPALPRERTRCLPPLRLPARIGLSEDPSEWPAPLDPTPARGRPGMAVGGCAAPGRVAFDHAGG